MERKEIIISKKIASLVEEKNGRAYYVGGYVRDLLRGVDNKDIDIEIHRINEDVLKSILSDLGEVTEYGKSFGIYGIKGYNLDIALPRSEMHSGQGHRGFDVKLEPDIGTFKASMRRDFTINSLMQDILTSEIIDHFGGLSDLKNKILKHTNYNTFSEDSLRVLRCAQFSARFNFDVSEETCELCRHISLKDLSKERVNEELKKALLKSKRPSAFFEFLKRIDKLDEWFPELIPLIGLEQNPQYHPEGDVWTHTMLVLDYCTKFRENSENPYAFMLLALCHDMGKAVCTTVNDGVIHSYNHETEGLMIIEKFLRRIISDKDIIKYVLNMSKSHMKPYVMGICKSSVKACNKMFDSVVSPLDIINFSLGDNCTKAESQEYRECEKFLFDRFITYKETMALPHVTGADLIDMGIEPGAVFGEVMKFAHKLRLAGIKRESALKEVRAYWKKVIKSI